MTATKGTLTPQSAGGDSIHKSVAPQKDIAASVRHLSKAYGESAVLEDISFDVAEGESLVLLGASGSGKTTILRIVAGLDQPDKGRNCRHESAAWELSSSLMHCSRE
jgi:ABC-type sulfate/molybdate transport systems ATPase subunit